MTAIFDVVVDNAELSVLGPPSQIDLAIDIGQQGIRGTKVFAGSGAPNALPTPIANPLEADLYVNVAGGANYGWLYRYDGSAWNSLLRMQPPVYSSTYSVSASNGSGLFSVPVSSILPADMTTPPAANFIITLQPLHSVPASITIVAGSKAISSGNLEFNVKLIVYSGGSFSDFTGTMNIDTRITVV
jgi:hypothetical protein